MARPSQYSRGRRLVLQATLLLVLLCTLALAALLERARAHELAVELTDKPLLTERLVFRYPRGWDVRQESEDVPVRAIEPKGDGGRGSRVIALQEGLSKAGDGQQLLRQYLGRSQGNLGTVQSITMLGKPGVIVPFESFEEAGDGELQRVPGWYAAVVLPDSGSATGRYGVVLAVRGESAEGRAGEKLLRQVAGGLSLRSR